MQPASCHQAGRAECLDRRGQGAGPARIMRNRSWSQELKIAKNTVVSVMYKLSDTQGNLIKVSEVREATPEEIEHGHAHGASGVEVVDEDEDDDTPRTLH